MDSSHKARHAGIQIMIPNEGIPKELIARANGNALHELCTSISPQPSSKETGRCQASCVLALQNHVGMIMASSPFAAALTEALARLLLPKMKPWEDRLRRRQPLGNVWAPSTKGQQ